MPWLLLDLLIALAAIAMLVLVLLRLWRRLKSFSRAVREAGDAVAVASDRLAAAQAEAPERR